MFLTDDLLLHYKRCPRRTFLDVYGDLSQQAPPPDFLLKLQQDSITHKESVLETVEKSPQNQATPKTPATLLLTALPSEVDISAPISPNYHHGDWEVGARATWDLMQQGINCIAKPILFMPTYEGINLVSFPDLLVKYPGQSNLGDWIYVPLTIKFGRKPKADYQIISAFHAYLLTVMQEDLPEIAWLILRRHSIHPVNLEQWMPAMIRVLAQCLETLAQQREPEVFISRQKCSLCRWYNSCHAIAKSQKHISLLPGVTPNRYRDLQELAIADVESLAQTDITILEPVFGLDIASDLIQQAQATVQNQPILRQPPSRLLKESVLTSVTEDSLHPDRNLVSAALRYANYHRIPPVSDSLNLPTGLVELFFDIEAQQDLNVDYLLGILAIDRVHHTETFYPLLAEDPQDEGKIWQEFLDLVERYPDAPIFHFSEYEVDTVKRLAKLYNTPTSQFKHLLSRFVDVHQQVIATVMLPVESYSLKHLARWLGFEWRDATVTGSQCVCLYDRWLAERDREALDLIQRYNEDDCRATYHLKTWLYNFLQTHHQA
ncbi:MAG TPA: recombinase B [Cyanobacteria bacterium UBA11149]|nr:recombinase B [Cyanobacteria bacterium UBA11367]HBE60778.1 recombinase B [Cyanobacteria bacterium UBA11366]HBK63840.1 recombinase B [Cyanobacteria bacterium UBA11166]HBR75387.1 recombinase B [Cyanobacteria bacterium UBA11159]HBS69923.1 recombinase B [Cyanobacteria bacterium UBA11153]HBW89988.1 recombinase B [Cyanobacteria bacterium UBA11149]HCA95696.1 recombinase B [Cyanobacteria bacterium UBA9226]